MKMLWKSLASLHVPAPSNGRRGARPARTLSVATRPSQPAQPAQPVAPMLRWRAAIRAGLLDS
jgi:hypothetical protein